jgi:short-subunit dehydrogenase
MTYKNLDSQDFKKKMIALITGASAGIGKELAVEFANDKIDLILVARREDSMKNHAAELISTYGIKVTVIAQDLGIPDSAEQLYKEVKSKGFAIDYLVNNAGFGDNGDFVDSDIAKNENMINLNILTLTKLTHLFGADMKARKGGTILNVASTASFQPGPLMSVYFATKHYVLAFSEGIAEELRPYNVYVSTLCPGPTQSEFGERAGFGKIIPSDTNPYPLSDEVAKFGYQQMKKKKVVFIHGFVNRVMANLVRFTPRSIVRKIAHSKMK